MKLTKARLIDAIADANGCEKKCSSELIETMLEIIKRTLEQGEDVLVSGFGKFRVKHKRERRGRNPETGDDMMLPARRVVKFKCSGKLREMINMR